MMSCIKSKLFALSSSLLLHYSAQMKFSSRLLLFISGPTFLCSLHHQPPHFDAPILPLFIFISPSSPFLPLRQSVYLFRPSGGALRLLIHSVFPLPIQIEGESYRLWTGYCTSLMTICYLFPVFMCGMHSLWSSVKFLRSAKRFHWLTSITDQTGQPVIKHLPLLILIHIPPSCHSLCRSALYLLTNDKLVLLLLIIVAFFPLFLHICIPPHFQLTSYVYEWVVCQYNSTVLACL